MKRHILWMIMGCVLPLVFILLAPVLGINGDMSLFVFVVAMFACHLMMPMNHKGHDQADHSDFKEPI